MRKLSILRQGNKSLRKKCRPIKQLTQMRKNKIQQMFKLMYANKGIGLAAPQVGWNARVFIMNITGKPNISNELVFINPTIIEIGNKSVKIMEGCLSIPDTVGLVERPSQVTIHAQALDGSFFKFVDDSMGARCAQHELDHLDGILFTDKLSK